MILCDDCLARCELSLIFEFLISLKVNRQKILFGALMLGTRYFFYVISQSRLKDTAETTPQRIREIAELKESDRQEGIAYYFSWNSPFFLEKQKITLICMSTFFEGKINYRIA